MFPTMALLAVSLCATAAGAEQWTRITSPDPNVNVEYRQDSMQVVSPSVRRATVRFVSSTGRTIRNLGIYSVETVAEYYCKQPLEKVLSAKVVAADGAVAGMQEVESPVFSELSIGSNSYLLWEAICK